MSRNTESHFGNAPMKNIRRSSFKRPFSHKTTFNTGDIVPIYAEEVLPGDTLKMHTATLCRMSTPINPVMDNAWMDTYYFFVPRRLVWDNWREFMGENVTDAWTETSEKQIPQLTAPEGGWTKGTIGEKLYGIQGRAASVDACYARAYALVFNEWFRSQNVTEPAEVSKGDATTAGSNGDDYVTDLQKGGQMAKAVKYADYFTRALPEPQKGPDIYLPLGTSAPIDAPSRIPVVGNGKGINIIGREPGATSSKGAYLAVDTNGNVIVQDMEDNAGWVGSESLKSTGLKGNIGLKTYDPVWQSNVEAVMPEMVADLSNATAATINQLRQAFAVQRMYEIDARGGTRYTEILRAHFGVMSPDGRQQRPEYLGGKRIPINITQVVQQSASDAVSPQGTTAAYSLTIDNHDDFTKSFDEHGIILGLAVIRTEHSYQQGLDRKFSRKNRTDFYWPALSNIGEQYIKNKEIYCGTEDDEDAFGYQEAWAEYRYANNKVTGEFNSDYTTPLDSWTYADDYSAVPTLSDTWIRETKVNVERTLAIQNQDQWHADFYFDQTWVRPMPIYSIPSMSSWN